MSLLVPGLLGRDRRGADVRNNTIKVIQPYYASGTWVFDDEATGLKAEPFVKGIPEMIDRLVADIPDAKTGFRLTFSASDFPDHELRIERGEAYGGGYHYRDPESGRSGWLCPALFRYFREAPPAIYVKADPLE
ncbi:MAG: hypothetical protein O2894_06400 [Planctomycetota bacterium]|nr:hypothetical protein [Planctomycetota bacterium]